MKDPSSGRPCPARIRRQIATKAEVEWDALMAWHEQHCPERLRGLSPDVAALLSPMPDLSTMARSHIGMRYVVAE